jgi:Tic22-like family
MKYNHSLRLIALGILGSFMIAPHPMVMAMTKQKVLQKLSSVPVFSIVSKDTQQPLVVTATDKGTKKSANIINFFLSPDEAKKFMDRLQADNKEVATKSEVRVSSLALAYAAFQEQQKDKKVEITVLPDTSSLKQAGEILKKNKQDPSKFAGIPLFFPAQKKDGKIAPLSLEVPGEKGASQSVTPMYLAYDLVSQQLDDAKKKSPEIKDAYVEMTTLGQLVDILEKNDDSLSQSIQLVPSAESLKMASTYKPYPEPGKSVPKSGEAPKPGAAPTTAPPAPAAPAAAPTPPTAPTPPVAPEAPKK